MPRFTFAAGNLRKILAAPLYVLGEAASLFARRDEKLWVFGSGVGVGEGALALARHAHAADPGLHIVWMARGQADIAQALTAGFDAVRKDSWRGFLCTLHAGVVVVTHGFGDANRYATRGAFTVQLWHGIPFKKIHLDSPETLRLPPWLGGVPGVRAALRRAYAYSGHRIGMFVAASRVAAGRLKTAFALDDRQFAITGDPRDDAVFGAPDEARQSLARLVGDERARTCRIILYAPTWRDGGDDPSIPGDDEWRRIGRVLEETDSILLLRSHPLGAGHHANTPARVKGLPATLAPDINPFLPAIDVLVTDYSSIAFDFALLGRPIVFFAPDLDAYTRRRGTYEPYACLSGGADVRTWGGLARRLSTLASDAAAAEDAARQAQSLARHLHDWHDGASTARTYDELRRRLAGAAPRHTLTPDAAPDGADAAADGPGAADRVPRRRPTRREPEGEGTPGAKTTGDGALDGTDPARTRPRRAALVIDSVALSAGAQTLRLAGRPARPPHAAPPPSARPADPARMVSPAAGVPEAVCLAGARVRLTGTVTMATGPGQDGRWSAEVPLRLTRWSGPELPPPGGAYRLVATIDGETAPCELAPDIRLPDGLEAGLFRLSWNRAEAALTIGAPLNDDERSSAGQERLAARYRKERRLEDAVFFESFYGQNASCNPRGIDRALAALRPDVTRYWSVADRSVPVPHGAVAVVEGTEAWWHARARARTLVVNDWLRKRYRRRYGQTVLQTWHGTPLKRIALMKRGLGPHARLAALREQSRWDLMLAQNPFSVAMFRKAYAFRRAIWQEGYPRNDILVTGDAALRASVRRRLGVTDETRLVLYAPTWRDDRPGEVNHIHAERFRALLGDGYAVLVRGHSRTLLPGHAVTGAGVSDVTGYPDVSELLLAADIVITDYSSIMFDATVTGKPLFFFVPDLERYRDTLRGFTFDLMEAAPGAVTTTVAELAEAVRHAGTLAAEYAERYARWRARFNPRDDGHAGRRVVLRMIRAGMV
ncbi:MAG TPA: CDP-glycerol glycerophosphotransferase family protein [Microbacteriaceae bacterium]|nr:CDP-glycerol glycerophosphotransferase family protein [Microbacteriaceae bacterium]